MDFVSAVQACCGAQGSRSEVVRVSSVIPHHVLRGASGTE
jgi:hypothetical protein